ncbi:MAG: hypothetical protein KAQ63_02455 [Candidatus Moranbacteria bacterium]|nr:hypothetical protein [Candidatus Moranbacteria bacterium]
MRKNKITINFFYSFILMNLLFWNLAGVVQAELFPSDIPSVSDITDEIEQRYGFDQDILRRAQKKGDYPEVEIFFDNTTPNAGEKVTVTAMPKYFKNSSENLYYTWFLFREGDSLSSAQVVEKAKRRAMGIVARGDFDPYLFGTSYAGSTSDPDDDGYDASFGGGNGVGGKEITPSSINDYESNYYATPVSKQVVDTSYITRCYRHNFGVSSPEDSDYSGVQSGEDLIVECKHKFAEADGSCTSGFEVGDGEFNNQEESCWNLDPTNPDTDGDGINDEADLAGLGQDQMTWTFEPGDRVGVMIEGTSVVITNESGSNNAYYKITWAGLDICDKEEVEGEDKRNLIENDECENSSDYGFTYLATESVYEKSEELLKSNLSFTPSAPQFNVKNNDYSDYIIVQSNFVQTGITDDFIYYDWDVYYCEQGTLDTCTSIPGSQLTTFCTNGDILGGCSTGNVLESSSYAEGIGIGKIKFKLSENFLSSRGEYDNFYLKVFLRAKTSKGASKVGVSSVDIPVVVDDNQIKIFEVFETSSGDFATADEICISGNYNKICPVFSGQIIAAEADIDIDGHGSSGVESYSWELNGQSLAAPKSGSSKCSFADGCELDEIVYLPMLGSGMDLQTISLKIKKTGGEEITSERIVSVTEPMAKIVSNNSSAWPWEVDDGTTMGTVSDEVLVGMIGAVVSFKAELVPSYLNGNLADNNISLIWYLNGQEVDSSFISSNSAYSIAVSGQDIEFLLDGQEGDSVNLKVEVIKEFLTSEENALKDNWDIQNVDTLKNKKSVTIKQTTDFSTGTIVMGSSIKMFAASTLANTPEYLIFMIRAAIMFVLFWAFVFGFDFWFSREIKLSK